VLHAGQLTGFPPSLWLDCLAEILSRLPLNVDKTLRDLLAEKQRAGEPMGGGKSTGVSLPGDKERGRVKELCMRCSWVVFDVLIFHFRSLRVFDGFQSLWLRFITSLAQNANTYTAPTESYFKSDTVDMIGSLLRLLCPPPDLTQTAEGTSLQGKKSPNVKEPDDMKLLQVSWHAVKAGCPSLLSLLRENYPVIVDSLAKQDPAASAGDSSESPLPSFGLYGRFFPSKSQVV
jgi:hypothetical protein